MMAQAILIPHTEGIAMPVRIGLRLASWDGFVNKTFYPTPAPSLVPILDTSSAHQEHGDNCLRLVAVLKQANGYRPMRYFGTRIMPKHLLNLM
jgi:hypothetical protein